MIVLKITIFFFGLIYTFLMIKEIIEKILAHSKKGEDEYHMLYTQGFINILPFWSTLLTAAFWTLFYFLSQVPT